MADCGICLDALRAPVSIPCGHVHCERCLRAHISSGTDALKSTCPTCRKPFYIATPDFTFVPQKYHDFILPSVRRIYMDIPSVTGMTNEINILTRRVEALVKENDHLRQHYADYRDRLKNTESDMRVTLRREEEARQEADELQKKFDSLKRRFRDLTRDECSATPSRRSVQNLDTSQAIFPKEEEYPVSLQDLNPSQARPKRALPKFRLSNTIHKDDKPQLVKRQRTSRHSDVSSSGQTHRVVFKSEDEDDE